ncbi:MAG: HlyC/CorC family transporter [Thermomicrobiales bacterium]|nr:HlyC/CorC family transporter [Thermomicrobiales bacterium]
MINLLILLLLVIVNGVLAASELSVVSARKARLEERAEKGDTRAQAALALAADPNRFLSTVQIGITLIAIVAGAFAGAALTEPVADLFRRIPGVAPYASVAAGIIVVGFITYLTLVIGEIVPKRLALMNPEAIALRVAGPMTRLAHITTPIVSVLAFSSNLLLRLLGAKAPDEPPVTEEEVERLLQEGTLHGVFAETERVLVQGVFDLGDRRVGELMTPRRRMIALDLTALDAVNRRRIIESPDTEFPVIDGSLDKVVGVVTVKALWGLAQPGEPLPLREAMTPALFIPESAPVLRALEQLRRTGDHLAVVVDEYGGVEGVLTSDHISAAITGDLGPNPIADARAVRRADGSWLLDGELPAHEARELLDLDTLPGEEGGEFETMAGFMMAQLGHIPVVGDSTDWAGWRFEVVDMDGNRVDRILATPLAPVEPATDA